VKTRRDTRIGNHKRIIYFSRSHSGTLCDHHVWRGLFSTITRLGVITPIYEEWNNMEGIMNLTSLPPDVIRLIASYGPVIAYRISLLCISCYKALKEYIPSTYGHLPISKHELLTYANDILDQVSVSLSSYDYKEIRAIYVGKDNDIGFTFADPYKHRILNGLSIVDEMGVGIGTTLRVFKQIGPNHEELLQLSAPGLGKESTGYAKPYRLPLVKATKTKIIARIAEGILPGEQYDVYTEREIYRRRTSCMRYDNSYATIMVMKTIVTTLESFGCSKVSGFTPKDFIKRFGSESFNEKRIYPHITKEIDKYLELTRVYIHNKLGEPSLPNDRRTIALCHAHISELYTFMKKMSLHDMERIAWEKE
jgi:hypothetical protein